MTQKKIFIQAAEQISIQQPLSQQWMEEPISYDHQMVKALNPPFRDYLAANEARRMGGLLKRALVTSLKVLSETGIEHPDAIITGTSIGSLDCTEKFLESMVENSEETLSPTHFMQSTHNTVGSTLGIYTKTHAYNTTYSHGAMSFDLAVLDAWMQMQLGKITTALVGGHDEMIEPHFTLLQKAGHVGQPGMVPCGEVAMSMMLTTQPSPNALCELAGIAFSSVFPAVSRGNGRKDASSQASSDCLCPFGSKRPEVERFRPFGSMRPEVERGAGGSTAVMTGINGNPANDLPYHTLIADLFPDSPRLHYKHLFGENYTSSALGLYAAAHCLKQNHLPPFIYDSDTPCLVQELNSILLVNQMENQQFSFILLKKL